MTSLDEYNKHLDYFQSKGYNEIDTARVYVGGKQEAWTRDAKWKDRGLTLATKVMPTEPGVHKPEKLREHLSTSLKELGTDTVDIYYLHAPDHSVPFEETLGALNELHRQGKFVQLGLSNFAAWEVAEVYNICKERGWVKPTIYQAMYNAISKLIAGFTVSSVYSQVHTARAIEPELIPCCRKYKIDIVVYSKFVGRCDMRVKQSLTLELHLSQTRSQAGFSAARSSLQTSNQPKVVSQPRRSWAICTAIATSRTQRSRRFAYSKMPLKSTTSRCWR